MVWHPGQLPGAGLVGDDREAPVDLHGVGRHDLGVQRFGERHGDLGLAHAGGPEQGDDRRAPPAQPQAWSQPASPKRLHREPFDGEGFAGRDTGLAQGDGELAIDRVDAGEVGQQHSAALLGRDDHAVATRVEPVARAGLRWD